MRDMPDPADQTNPPILALVRDLMFLGRINAAAQAAGVTLKVIRDPGKLAGEPGLRLIVDLNLDGAIDAARVWKGALGNPTRDVIGFVSHTDAATIARARDAGIDRVLARSRFVETLPELLRERP